MTYKPDGTNFFTEVKKRAQQPGLEVIQYNGDFVAVLKGRTLLARLTAKEFSALARAVTLAERESLHKIIGDLVDAGFKNPIITFESAVAYLEEPTVPGHPELQRLSRKKRQAGEP